MSYTNTYAGVDGVVLKAADANDQFDAIETAFAAVVDGQLFTGPINYRGADGVSATNSGYGEQSLTALNGGLENSSHGYQALRLLTSGQGNSAYGAYAMQNMLTGDNNNAFGYSALAGCSTGNYNTVFGHSAALVYTGDGITAFGYQAATLATGTQITAIGYNALAANTTASANVAVGYNALSSCVDGGFNVAVGRNALLGALGGTLNVAVGDGASVDLTSGTHNVAIGALSGLNVTTASNSTYVGYSAYGGNHANSTGIGYNARVTADNQVVIGNSSVTETVLRGQVKGGAGTGTGQPVLVGVISVNSTPVGNVGAGTDDLMTYALPADSLSANNKGIRVSSWGTTAANANAKTLTFAFGATTVLSKSIALGAVAIQWRVEATILRASSGAQVVSALLYYGESPNSCTPFLFSASPTESESGAITIKCTGAATADNDIVQRGMVVEFFNT